MQELMGDVQATETAVRDRLQAVLANHLRKIPEGTDWTSVPLPDLGLDSLSAIDLVIDIEETFGAEFPANLLVRETFATFAALEAVVTAMVRSA
ncbi:acyl carrier protein [Micromonospora sp. NBC_00421]|uniref:acyl carrier protein n=1 Tax=Micromonospora sp. NBC_00421 TaxID=2975976 RepID=UPI002E219462